MQQSESVAQRPPCGEQVHVVLQIGPPVTMAQQTLAPQHWLLSWQAVWSGWHDAWQAPLTQVLPAQQSLFPEQRMPGPAHWHLNSSFAVSRQAPVQQSASVLQSSVPVADGLQQVPWVCEGIGG